MEKLSHCVALIVGRYACFDEGVRVPAFQSEATTATTATSSESSSGDEMTIEKQVELKSLLEEYDSFVFAASKAMSQRIQHQEPVNLDMTKSPLWKARKSH
eukprot:TRINITY_DN24565_c0_g1_i1.p1 TRINITY_DN24565_c0_g1~~TRINITY_DN24565_c0_g1_i1.p1  ORF type:complete len:101 (-),score=12.55 TRINITY_DN24565_c0_g1_i1:154-456(-)